MNKDRRKKIDAAIGEVLALVDKVREQGDALKALADEEREYYDNMPENMQSSERGDNADSDANKLEEWADALTDAAEAMEQMNADELDH